MPNRLLKESICTSEDIEQLNWFEEVLFYRLIVNCDDYGRMDGRLTVLRARLFPLKQRISMHEIQLGLDHLASIGCVARYEVDGLPYLCLPNWSRHQQIRAQRSKYPAPPGEKAPKEPPEIICNQMISDVPVIQSESNPNLNLNPNLNPNPNLNLNPNSGAEAKPTSSSPPVREACRLAVSVINERAKTHYRPESKETVRLISELLSQGYTAEDLVTVVNRMADAWLSPVAGQKNMSGYFRPETLFGPKFESYLNQPEVKVKRDPKDTTPLIFQLDRIRNGCNDDAYQYDGDDSL